MFVRVRILFFGYPIPGLRGVNDGLDAEAVDDPRTFPTSVNLCRLIWPHACWLVGTEGVKRSCKLTHFGGYLGTAI